MFFARLDGDVPMGLTKLQLGVNLFWRYEVTATYVENNYPRVQPGGVMRRHWHSELEQYLVIKVINGMDLEKIEV